MKFLIHLCDFCDLIIKDGLVSKMFGSGRHCKTVPILGLCVLVNPYVKVCNLFRIGLFPIF